MINKFTIKENGMRPQNSFVLIGDDIGMNMVYKAIERELKKELQKAYIKLEDQTILPNDWQQREEVILKSIGVPKYMLGTKKEDEKTKQT